jgi:hypothetical protein
MTDREGREIKGNQNPPNTSSWRPPAPGGSGGFSSSKTRVRTLAWVEVDHGLGETVYHIASEDGVKGIVTGYLVRPFGLLYAVTWGNSRSESYHYASELTTDKPLS